MFWKDITFRAERWQLVTEAFSSSRGHDQKEIPAGQRQVDSPQLQRSEPRQTKRVLQMLRHLLGPWKTYQTRAKQREVSLPPSTSAESFLSSCGLTVPVPSKRCNSCLLRTGSGLDAREEEEGDGPAAAQASPRRCSRASLRLSSFAFFCCSSAIRRSTSSSSASTRSNCSCTSDPGRPAAPLVSVLLPSVYRVVSVELVSHLSWPQEDHTSTPNHLILPGFLYSPSTLVRALSTSAYIILRTDRADCCALQLRSTHTRDQDTSRETMKTHNRLKTSQQAAQLTAHAGLHTGIIVLWSSAFYQALQV